MRKIFISKWYFALTEILMAGNSNLILKNISKHVLLEKEEAEYFISLLTNVRIDKKKFLLREGDVCKHSAFVTSGCLRGYTIDNSGNEHILQFAPPEWWIADMYSLLSQRPGNLNIDAMEDTEVLLLSKSDQEKLYKNVPKFERFFRIITEKSLVASRQRVIDNLSSSAMQRYEKFCTLYPTIISTIPQKYVASYIGVTPEFLSKLKAQRFKSLKSRSS